MKCSQTETLQTKHELLNFTKTRMLLWQGEDLPLLFLC